MSAASVRLSVDGITCLHCVGTVQKALEGVGGVRRAEVDLASGVARVDADADAREWGTRSARAVDAVARSERS